MGEARSSLDTRTECLIQKARESCLENRTSFVIAHRLTSIRNSDQSLVMDDGRIIECYEREELLENKGLYHDLYMSHTWRIEPSVQAGENGCEFQQIPIAQD